MVAEILSPTLVKTDKFFDNRGYFQEILRDSQVPHPIKQVSTSQTYPGVIKAFHIHHTQWDYWCLIGGRVEAKAVHKDTGECKTFYLTAEDHQMLIIPPGWWHGYRVLGTEPCNMLYMVTEEYDLENPDEEKNSPFIHGVTWDTQDR